MLISYKDRKLEEGMVVQVYRNLHNEMFSIRDKKTRLVLAHGNGVVLRNCKAVVSQAGRKKVIQENRKNVHAYIEGEYYCTSFILGFEDIGVGLYYNPYTLENFVDSLTKEEINGIMDLCYFKSGKAYYL